MSRSRRIILICYCACLIVTFLIVPWKAAPPGGNRRFEVTLGYAPLWNGPKPPSEHLNLRNDAPRPIGYVPPAWYAYATVDSSRVILEVGALSVLCALAFLLTPTRKHQSNG